MPMSTPMDVRLGLTKAQDAKHPLRWGIIGTGAISAQWAMCLRSCPGATLQAVAARSAEKAKKFAGYYGIKTSYGSYAEMVASPDVDVVYIGTVTRLHKEHSLLAIAAGKHVLCEKPLADSADDARAMYAAAEERGVMLQDAMWTRFFPAVEHARAAIDAGAIGKVRMVQSDFFDPIYCIQAAPMGFGAQAVPRAIVAAGRGFGGAVAEYTEGQCAVFAFTQFNAELAEATEFIGTHGRITLGQPGHCPTRVTIRVPPKVPSRYTTQNVPSPEQIFDYPLPGNVSLPAWAYTNQHGFLYQAEAVHRCLAAGLRVCPQYNKEESLHAMELLTEITKARVQTHREAKARLEAQGKAKPKAKL
uniref:D-xylose 1-dehydrogenase (NADP(+), D-xylono-1,5-lactone-forming) n=1 Tax=Alexandrium catenella TaxID=2925 RepID=A0A7S1LR94_ALECA